MSGHVTNIQELSYNRYLVGVFNNMDRWEWNFIFSDGSRTFYKSGYLDPSFKEIRIQPEDAKVQKIRIQYWKADTRLTGLELLDKKGNCLLSAGQIDSQRNNPKYSVKETYLEEDERIIGF